jgi:hypothetical protein
MISAKSQRIEAFAKVSPTVSHIAIVAKVCPVVHFHF